MNHREVVMRRFSPEEIVEIWERLSDGQSVRSVAIGLGRYPSAVPQLVMRTGGAPPLVVKSRGPRFFICFRARRNLPRTAHGLEHSIHCTGAEPLPFDHLS
jgi:hypothetical protein